MYFYVPVILEFNSLRVSEYDSKAMGSTLNEDESEEQIFCKIFNDLEKAALILELLWSDNQAITKWFLDLLVAKLI